MKQTVTIKCLHCKLGQDIDVYQDKTGIFTESSAAGNRNCPNCGKIIHVSITTTEDTEHERTLRSNHE